MLMYCSSYMPHRVCVAYNLMYVAGTSPVSRIPSSYFVPYPDAPGGYLVPYPPSYTPTTPLAPVPYGIEGWNPIFGVGPVIPAPSPTSTPSPAGVYYGNRGSNGSPRPYAYSPRPLFGHNSPGPASGAVSPTGSAQSPLSTVPGIIAQAPGTALAPFDFIPTAPAPAPGVVTPAAAPGPAALCACSPADTTARNVKIEVLSTAYNSSSTDTIKFNAYLTFSHPVQSLNSSQIRVFTRQTAEDGTKSTVPGVVTLLSPVCFSCLSSWSLVLASVV